MLNTRTLLAGLVTSLFFFFAGWALYGILLMPTYMEGTMNYEGLMKAEDMSSMVGIYISQLAWGMLIAIMLERTGSTDWKSGMVTAMLIGFLALVGIDASFYAFFNLYSFKILMLDIAVGTLFYGAGGAVAGLILGKKS